MPKQVFSLTRGFARTTDNSWYFFREFPFQPILCFDSVWFLISVWAEGSHSKSHSDSHGKCHSKSYGKSLITVSLTANLSISGFVTKLQLQEQQKFQNLEFGREILEFNKKSFHFDSGKLEFPLSLFLIVLINFQVECRDTSAGGPPPPPI